jgi:hypothetical protein
MLKNLHFIILVSGTIIFLLLTFFLIQKPIFPVPFTGPDMDIKIYSEISQVIMGSLWNGTILSVAIKIFFGYFAFVIMVFGHYHFTRTGLKS